MTMVIIIDIVLLITIFVGAILLNKHLIGAGLAFVLVAIETASGTDGVWEVVSRTMAIFCIATLVMLDGKKNGKNSLLVQYNPYAQSNKLPNWLRTMLVSMFGIVFIIRFILSVLGVI